MVYSLTGNPKTGKDIYEISCLWCHNAKNGVSHYVLDDSRNSFKHLDKMMFKDFPFFSLSNHCLWNLLYSRSPTLYATLSRRKMSKQQVEDLRSYIKLRSKGETLKVIKNFSKKLFNEVV